MSRVGIIAGAIRTYVAGQSLPSSEERVDELARFIEDHLAPASPEERFRALDGSTREWRWRVEVALRRARACRPNS